MKLSFVIPCYGSEQTISGVVDEIVQTVAMRPEFDYEIILVNDCSPDKVYSVIKTLAENNKKIKGINLSKNFGQHAALMAGYRHVSGDIIVCLDDDGQTPANEAFLLIDAITDEQDIVFAKYEKKKHSIFRNMGSAVNEFMLKYLLSKPKDLTMSSYFACKRFIIDEIIRYENSYPYIGGLILRVTKNCGNVFINHRSREVGSSGYNYLKLLSLWINGFTSFSAKPLRLATFLGVFSSFVGFIGILVILIRKLINPDIAAGYSSTMATIMLFCGIILLVLGLLGEYVGRMYISLNNSPQYVVKGSVNIDEDA